MADPENVRLLFGPYKAPNLRRGDRAVCLLRGCTVVVTGWTGARIPWPRCQAVTSHGAGGQGLLIEAELARAVRHEAECAVGYWWGACPTAVRRWRKALGVTRTSNPGSARLIRAAAEQGGQAARAREWTEEERERCRRLNAELGLARNLVLGYHGPRWTPQDIALLGVLPDEEVARRTGRTVGAVQQKRHELGIPNPDRNRNRWTAEEVALLGALPDEEVARRVGRSLLAVIQKRIKVGIANPFDGRKRQGAP